jgi:aspartyl-tRNA(Asn)/glutamyl-tRNA(Gln) amidotransferase subunit A
MSGADPVAVLEACLARIAARNPALNAFLAVDTDGARQAALASSERIARGHAISPVDGLPIGIKANIAVAAMPWHAGLGTYRNRVATYDASCVARLREGGAVLLGILNMDEGALGGATDNPFYGRTENPHRAGCSAGGSSGGAGAAVASGMCVAALGTDTLGSVRIPAAYCGVIGCKPAHGAISLHGVVPLAPRFDTVGVLARDASCAGAVLAWLGAAPPLAMSRGTLGVLASAGTAPSPAILAALQGAADAAARHGWRVQNLALPGFTLRALKQAALLLTEVEAAAVHGEAIDRDPAGFSNNFRAMLAWGASQPAAKLAAATSLLSDAAVAIRDAFAPCDAVLMPATPAPAFRFADGPGRDQADFTVPANITGLAATAFPAGIDEQGLPLAVQCVSPNAETTLHVAASLMVPRPEQKFFASFFQKRTRPSF